jgi:hypothetical protein
MINIKSTTIVDHSGGLDPAVGWNTIGGMFASIPAPRTTNTPPNIGGRGRGGEGHLSPPPNPRIRDIKHSRS